MEGSSRRAIWLRHDDIFAHDVPGHPERPARIRALEAEMSAHDWFGATRVEAPEVARDVLELVHPAAYVDSIRELCEAGRRRDRRRHLCGAGDVRGGAAGVRAAPSRWSTRCWAARPTWA